MGDSIWEILRRIQPNSFTPSVTSLPPVPLQYNSNVIQIPKSEIFKKEIEQGIKNNLPEPLLDSLIALFYSTKISYILCDLEREQLLYEDRLYSRRLKLQEKQQCRLDEMDTRLMVKLSSQSDYDKLKVELEVELFEFDRGVHEAQMELQNRQKKELESVGVVFDLNEEQVIKFLIQVNIKFLERKSR